LTAIRFIGEFGNHLRSECLHAGLPIAVDLLMPDPPNPRNRLSKDVIPARPVDIARWIRAAITEGWEPEIPGPQFFLRVTGHGDKRMKQVVE
jgi:hypothetical protein